MKTLNGKTHGQYEKRLKLDGVDLVDELDQRGLEPYESGDHFLMALCPFHDDQSPSLSVNVRSGKVQCFTCETKGDMADVIAETDDISRADALKGFYREEDVSDIVSDVYKFLSTADEKKTFNRKSFAKAFPPVQKYPKAVKYLKSRGIEEASMKKFFIRYAPSGKMTGRVILPILTDTGELVSYVGRTIRGDIPKTRKQGEKRSTLFGIYQLARALDKAPYIVVVEGEFDAVYLQQYGIPAVAVMGTAALTSEQIRLLKKYGRKAVLAYDGDNAGEKSVWSNFRILSKYMPTVPLLLPEGKDPNSLSETEIEDIFEPYKAALGGSYE